MDKEHDHAGPWWGIGVAVLGLLLLWMLVFAHDDYHIDTIYDQVAEIELRIACAAPAELFYDVDGNEVCLEPAD